MNAHRRRRCDEAGDHDQEVRMGDDELTIGTADTPEGECRRIVVVPSRSLDRWHEPLAERQAYEERLLTFLFELRDPRLEITYVSSLPIASSTIDYHLSMLPASSRASARSRLDLVAVGDAGARPLSEKLLRHRSALDRVRRTIRPSQQAAVGVTTIAETPEQADALYSAAEAALSRTPRADRDASERRRRSAA
jgi:hypothetical protein